MGEYKLPNTGDQVATAIARALGIIVPTHTSQLQNDSGFVTAADVPTKTSQLQNDSGFVLSSDLTTETTRAMTEEERLAGLIASVSASLVNYYTKTETYNKTEVNNLIGAIQQFHYEIYPSLSSVTNPQSNVLYLIGPTGSGSDKYEEYVYANSDWTKIGDTTIDLSGYSTTEEVEAMLNSLWADVLEELDKKANKDGWYSKMVVGAAESLIAKELSEAVISYRATPSGTGVASIAKIKGRTDAWNQLGVALGANTGTSVNPNTTRSDSFTITHNNTAATSSAFYYYGTQGIVVGHKYLVCMDVYADEALTLTAFGNNWAQIKNIAVTTAKQRFEFTYQFNSLTAGVFLYFGIGAHATSGAKIYLSNAILVDLTLAYGSGKEPTTVAAFLKEYSYALGASYNAGKLLCNSVTGMETTGLNQWDEVAEIGSIDANGNNVALTDRLRSKNYMPVFPNTAYYFKTPSVLGVYWYDINKNFISSTSAVNSVLTSPSNAYYLRFYVIPAYGTTYKNDIAINLSHSGIRNGEYEPYWQSTLNLGHSKIYGKLNGAGEMVQVAPNGFRGVGANCDEVDVVRKEAYIRRAWVDMGTLTWELQSGSGTPYPRFRAALSGLTAGASAELMCAKYPTAAWPVSADKSLYFNPYNAYVYVKDTSYATAAAFKTAMSGVMLDYQLATPLHYTDLMYSEDGGQTLIEIPSNYRVDDFGTERRLPDGIVDGAPASTPLVALINYPIDLPKTYQNQDSMDDLLNKLASALGFTWSKTWDGVKYVYTITNNS